MENDQELLRRFAEHRSEDAFRQLVERYTALVYSAAVRQTGGDSGLAQEVAQTVFIDLARKAGTLADRSVLASWLFTATRYAALNAVRERRRRTLREQEALTMEEIEREPRRDPDWDEIRPTLDAALCELSDTDREAILLRYFEGQPFAALGARLGIAENAARMRAERALDRLRVRLAGRGVTSTATALGLVLCNRAVAAPPAGLAAAIAGGALAKVAAVGGAGWAGPLLKIGALKNVSSTPFAAATVVATGLAFHEVDENAKYGAFFIYTVCFGVGVVFTIVSAALGHLFDGGHADFHHEGAGGHSETGMESHDMPGFALIGPTTLATFITAFGGLGMILTRMEVTHRFSGPLAAVGAAAIALVVGLVFRAIFRRTQASSEGRVADLVGSDATVITAIPADGVGEIAYIQSGSRYSAPARAPAGASIAGGATVRIARVVGAFIHVEPT